MLKPGEPILIEQVSNGFIVNPKEISSFTKLGEDIHVFSDLESLWKFLDKHFNNHKQVEIIR